MPAFLGANSPRIALARSLHAAKGRREHQRFLLEGPTLLAEAQASGLTLETIFATEAAYDRFSAIREIEAGGVPTFLVDERTAAKVTDVRTPSGVAAIAHARLAKCADLLTGDGIILLLADLNDPGNAGTLLRSADAFGISRIIFGNLGVDPYLPKVVRAAMGSLFRCQVAICTPPEIAAAALGSGWQIAGLGSGGLELAGYARPSRLILVVGHERAGLGPWGPLCSATLGISMRGKAESLNAGVAGAIALYELTRAPA
ncbi:MAG: RNA methyltransferase [Candidatus Eremiobacteraeota bacterium]|nr:RNA methyltransferase [Candidatus Eremiobacteraeota bacterium]